MYVELGYTKKASPIDFKAFDPVKPPQKITPRKSPRGMGSGGNMHFFVWKALGFWKHFNVMCFVLLPYQTPLTLPSPKQTASLPLKIA